MTFDLRRGPRARKLERSRAMVVVLMVAEKPSLARSLAEILSKQQCRRRKSACSACDVYEFDCVFPPTGVRAAFKMTSVCGHVMSLDFRPQYNRWEQIDPVGDSTHEHTHTSLGYDVHVMQVELFDAETTKKEAIPNLRLCHFLQSEVREGGREEGGRGGRRGESWCLIVCTHTG